MFTNPTFANLINPHTLKFKITKPELHYRSSREEEYQRRFSPFYLILGSIVIMLCTTSYLTYRYYDNDQLEEGQGAVIATTIIFAGVILEFSISFFPKLRKIRTVPLGLCIFFGTAVLNCFIETSPVLRPGFVFFCSPPRANKAKIGLLDYFC